MRSLITYSRTLDADVEILTDGAACWVNCADGNIARWTPRKADIHHPPRVQADTGRQCLDCAPMTWEQFRAAIWAHYEIAIPPGLLHAHSPADIATPSIAKTPGKNTLNSHHGRNQPMENLIDDAESYAPLTVSGARNILVLDPTTPRLYLFRHVGAGIPEAVADRRELALDDVPTSVVPESLHAWLTARTGDILDIVARYRGEQYADGSRYVGQWDHPDPGESLDLGVFDAVSSGLIECYWDACDYLEPAVGEFIRELFDGTPINTIVEREVANALTNGARITADATREYLMSMLADITVSAAASVAEDYDTGHITELLGDGMAVVSWNSGARTNHPIADLTVE